MSLAPLQLVGVLQNQSDVTLQMESDRSNFHDNVDTHKLVRYFP